MKTVAPHLDRFAVDPTQLRIVKHAKYAPDQPRDDQGRFAGDGAGPTVQELMSGAYGNPMGESADVVDKIIAAAKRNFHSDEVEKKLTDQETFAIRDYVSSGFEDTNQFLRTGTDWQGKPPDDHDKQQIALLDSAIEKSEIPKDMWLYRGVTGMDFKEGQTFTDPAYLSTSLYEPTAESFGGMSPESSLEEEATGHVVQLSVPKGMNGLYVSENLTDSDGEMEVILPRNTQFQIDSVDNASGTVKAHVVPS